MFNTQTKTNFGSFSTDGPNIRRTTIGFGKSNGIVKTTHNFPVAEGQQPDCTWSIGKRVRTLNFNLVAVVFANPGLKAQSV